MYTIEVANCCNSISVFSVDVLVISNYSHSNGISASRAVVQDSFLYTIRDINQIYGLAPKPWPHLQEHFYHRPHTCSQALPYAYQFGCLLLLPLRKLGRLELLYREI